MAAAPVKKLTLPPVWTDLPHLPKLLNCCEVLSLTRDSRWGGTEAGEAGEASHLSCKGATGVS